MSVKAAITPTMLTWARESAGYSVDTIAEKLNRKSVLPETVQAWEGGGEQPTYAQLKEIARICKRPIAIFYFPAPPDEETLGEKFRSLLENYTDKDGSPINPKGGITTPLKSHISGGNISALFFRNPTARELMDIRLPII